MLNLFQGEEDMSVYEYVHPYISVGLWIVVSVVVGVCVLFGCLLYLNNQIRCNPEDTNDRRIEFSFCLGCLCTCTLFLVYITWQLWTEFGSPFSLIHSLQSLLWVGNVWAIWWLYSELKEHHFWVRLYMHTYPRQTA